jgi:hypothetical protein
LCKKLIVNIWGGGVLGAGRILNVDIFNLKGVQFWRNVGVEAGGLARCAKFKRRVLPRDFFS